jgi:hypothetical protein
MSRRGTRLYAGHLRISWRPGAVLIGWLLACGAAGAGLEAFAESSRVSGGLLARGPI